VVCAIEVRWDPLSDEVGVTWQYGEEGNMTKRLLLLPGDGIGPEVCGCVRRVADWLIAEAHLDMEIEEQPFGGACYDQFGSPLSDNVRDAALAADAVLMGAVGGPKWDDVPRDKRPEAGLLNLRVAMQVFANLRPAYCFAALADASTLRQEVIAGLDMVIVRELTGGIYFGQPRGIDRVAENVERGFDTQVYTTPEIERVARTAFLLARERSRRVTSVDKANVMESGVLWRRVVSTLHRNEFADVELRHMYADNCAMQLIRNPRQFDVILTDNLFGDLLSDAAAMVTGSLGMLASAALGDPGKPGLYEPIHGSAPDIAGMGIANPLGTILSLQMALKVSFDRPDLAQVLQAAIGRALDGGARTRDLGGTLGSEQMTTAVIEALANE
jgi:3-isopropylmalate dehydrogenase